MCTTDKGQEVLFALHFSPYFLQIKDKWQTTVQPLDNQLFYRHSIPPPQPACHVEADAQRARHVGRYGARARPSPSPAPFRPRTRARAPPPHVGVSPPLSQAPPPPPLLALYSKSGSLSRMYPGFPLPLPLPLPRVWPSPRAPIASHLSRGGGLRGPLGEVQPPWPPSTPATALVRVAAAAGSSTAGPRRFQVGPRLPLLPLPAVPAAPSGPLLSPRRWDGLAAVAAGALTTPPAGNCSRCSARGPGAAEAHPRDPPPPRGEGWSEGRTQSMPCGSLGGPTLVGKAVQ